MSSLPPAPIILACTGGKEAQVACHASTLAAPLATHVMQAAIRPFTTKHEARQSAE
ncbi:hypothetical protein FRC08_012924 [Ceratobasidium sp. 394]|nr:hypothetical protein FRC08_012924 [Ceratobasidium sp. 394]